MISLSVWFCFLNLLLRWISIKCDKICDLMKHTLYTGYISVNKWTVLLNRYLYVQYYGYLLQQGSFSQNEIIELLNISLNSV